ncbi:hypothetical protein WOLCODRAFT_164444 [Wolfiporia cocos MD-104 SS10]|uniref:Uncharacterized protein n=1 Tax=Wolfiporia cocos (strain MD-104) TaxID=742152 RepID=A0A2H3JMP2_WOLCO|nr:hypothetical protein WOLCODRAFT_164444 [Wolfiporia cocos MD-104 SS10]
MWTNLNSSRTLCIMITFRHSETVEQGLSSTTSTSRGKLIHIATRNPGCRDHDYTD